MQTSANEAGRVTPWEGGQGERIDQVGSKEVGPKSKGACCTETWGLVGGLVN